MGAGGRAAGHEERCQGVAAAAAGWGGGVCGGGEKAESLGVREWGGAGGGWGCLEVS